MYCMYIALLGPWKWKCFFLKITQNIFFKIISFAGYILFSQEIYGYRTRNIVRFFQRSIHEVFLQFFIRIEIRIFKRAPYRWQQVVDRWCKVWWVFRLRFSVMRLYQFWLSLVRCITILKTYFVKTKCIFRTFSTQTTVNCWFCSVYH